MTGTFLYNAAPPMFNLGGNLKRLGLSAPADLPKKFDWRKELTLAPVFDQNPCKCGGCWALSTSGAFADRVRIKSKLKDAVFEPTILIECLVGQSKGCQGGFPMEAGQFLENQGLQLLSKDIPSCQEFNTYCPASAPERLTANCQEIKSDCAKNQIIKAEKNSTHTIVKKKNGKLDGPAILAGIKAEVMTDGPCVGSYMVYQDFVLSDWKKTKGIYINGAYDDEIRQSGKYIDPTPPSQKMLGGHAVEIVGWGEEKLGEVMVPYWIIKNSWGPTFQDKGYFKMAMTIDGRNARCGIDVPLVMGQGELFGGVTLFEPQLTKDMKTSKKASKPQDMPKIRNISLIVIGVLVLLVIVFLILKKTKVL